MKPSFLNKLPRVDMVTLTPYGLALSGIGFLMMMADLQKEIGAIVFVLGLIPLLLSLPTDKNKKP